MHDHFCVINNCVVLAIQLVQLQHGSVQQRMRFASRKLAFEMPFSTFLVTSDI